LSRRSIIASMQQSVEKLAAGQETMARDIARLQAADQPHAAQMASAASGSPA